jgi:hypothetical protein
VRPDVLGQTPILLGKGIEHRIGGHVQAHHTHQSQPLSLAAANLINPIPLHVPAWQVESERSKISSHA